MNVLFVCTGNTCRSPIAETLMDDAVDRSSILHGDVKTKSAGTFACEGAEATEEAVRVLEEMGLELKRHVAEPFTPEMAQWADIILAMSKEQMEHIEVIAPEEVNKVHTLLGYAKGIDGEPTDNSCDLMDPFDEGMEEYRQSAAQLKEAVEMLVSRMEKEQ
ncbi:MAG: low molecular weight protein arginine phosphatase [Christensenella sp.]|uniref:arsenate reductase/protein-tyrosine-phosphatase family protein n=1 Tax=Christensenella sp. TaxID=1935934 RepID=UPI002B21C1C6|nr:low molecular weight protein arginine phosphatase [Christensenella sp.]MEA5004739.1 low molecular weight protein arginine phosphatase [Christensenella sp.]